MDVLCLNLIPGRAVCAMTPGKSSSRLKDALVEEDREHEDTVSELPGSDAESSMRSLRESASQLALDDKHADRGILKHLPTPASGALAEQARASAGQGEFRASYSWRAWLLFAAGRVTPNTSLPKSIQAQLRRGAKRRPRRMRNGLRYLFV